MIILFIYGQIGFQFHTIVGLYCHHRMVYDRDNPNVSSLRHFCKKKYGPLKEVRNETQAFLLVRCNYYATWQRLYTLVRVDLSKFARCRRPVVCLSIL